MCFGKISYLNLHHDVCLLKCSNDMVQVWNCFFETIANLVH